MSNDETTNAIICDSHGGPDVMQWRTVPLPVPAADELRVRVEAVGVNYVDTMRRSGKHPSAPDPPFTPGIELVGIVEAIGDGVSRFAEGDRVIGRCVTDGAYAEAACVEERFTVACPAEIPADEAAGLFVNPLTAWHALHPFGGVTGDDTVLITAAAGGVGVCAVQLARQAGARVVAAAGTEPKRQLAADLGADVTVDYTDPDWPAAVLDATGGEGVSLVLESVGGEVFSGCLDCWAPGGRLVVFGQACGTAGTLPANILLFGNRTVRGLALGTVIENEAVMREGMDRILEAYRAGDLRIIVGETHAIADAAEAHRRLEGRQTHGKVVLRP